jgi:hypothetical protein
MQEDNKKQAFPRDRNGEIFGDLKPDDVDSQEADEFMKRQFGKGNAEKPRSENRPAQPRK